MTEVQLQGLINYSIKWSTWVLYWHNKPFKDIILDFEKLGVLSVQSYLN